MIIKQEDIKTYGLSKDNRFMIVKVHIPTNVFFENVSEEVLNEPTKFIGFRVARYVTDGKVVEEKKFNGKKDSSFFKAVEYFELLIDQNTPKEEKQDQQDEQESVGTFTFYQSKNNGTIRIGTNSFNITPQDIEKVFTPPQTKKYGRLDMTVLENPIYDTVRSKFALRYNKEASEQQAGHLRQNVSEVWVYDLFPYSNGGDENGQNDNAPQEMNKDSLTLDQIEKEEPEQREPKNPQEQQQQDKDKEKQREQGDKNESGEPQETQKDEDLGWDDDEEEDRKKSDESKGSKGEKEPKDNSDLNKEENPEQGNSNGDESKGNEPNDDTNDDSSENGDTSDNGEGEPDENATNGTGVTYNFDLLSAINNYFKTDDFLSQTQNLTKFMTTFAILPDSTLKNIGKQGGISDENYDRNKFLATLKQQITPFFDKL
jgi:hypothetical protein